MADKKYTSVYNIQDSILKNIAPKYFDLEDINHYNVGLFGMITNIGADITEDVFNSMSTYINEMFASKARITESIYNHLAPYRYDDLFAKPAQTNIILFVNEKEILSFGEKKNEFVELRVPDSIIIDIEGKLFAIDYDILIKCKSQKGEYVYSAVYDMNYNNSISTLKNPFIKIKQVVYDGNRYLGLFITVRQVVKEIRNEILLSNDRINFPRLELPFVSQPANFEIFYRENEKQKYTQLQKKLLNTAPSKEPFCYFNFKNDNMLHVTFNSRDNYFQPKFGSEVLLYSYNTDGDGGNFNKYTGFNMKVYSDPKVTTQQIPFVMFGLVQSESVYGRNKPTKEELRSIAIEKQSTVDSYTTENDLQLHFLNLQSRISNTILFIKKRDDIFDRLFTAYTLLRNEYNEIYHTNTLKMEITDEDFDIEYEQSDVGVIKPGKVYVYDGSSKELVKRLDNKTILDDISSIETTNKFAYANPFLMTISKRPSVVSFYLNTINDNLEFDYTYINNNSLMQFICNNITIERNGIYGEKTYKIRIKLTPSTDVDNTIIDEAGLETGDLKLKLMYLNSDDSFEICHSDFKLINADKGNNIYEYETILDTDDYITSSKKIKINNGLDMTTGEEGVFVIPMTDCKLRLCAFYKNPLISETHPYTHLSDIQYHTMTNIYTTEDKKAQFLIPFDMVKSQISYTQMPDMSVKTLMSHVPLIRAKSLKNPTVLKQFVDSILLQYTYMEESREKLENNYSMDIKFFNTYGYSKNFMVENGSMLDKVNASIRFKINYLAGTNEVDLKKRLKEFIKSYIEQLNVIGDSSVYVSNIITEIESNFPEVVYIKFAGINNYDTTIQYIKNIAGDFDLLTKEQRRDFIPEYITLELDDIIIDFIYN